MDNIPVNSGYCSTSVYVALACPLVRCGQPCIPHLSVTVRNSPRNRVPGLVWLFLVWWPLGSDKGRIQKGVVLAASGRRTIRPSTFLSEFMLLSKD